MRLFNLAALLLARQGALAAGSGGLSLVYGDQNSEPWGIPKDEFEDYFSHPDYVLAVKLQAPDMSRPFESNFSVDNATNWWGLGVSIRTDIPLTHNSKDAKFASSFTTAGEQVLIAPRTLVSEPSLDLHIDESWSMCLVTWTDYTNVPDDFRYPDAIRSDIGNCSSVLSTECRAYIKNPPADADESVKGCHCPDLEKIPACRNDIISPFTVGCTATPLNASDISTFFDNGTHGILTWADASASAKGNLNSFKNVGSTAWPVVLKFGNSSALTSSGDGFARTDLYCPVAKSPAAWDNFAPKSEGSSLRGSFSPTTIALWAAVLFVLV